MQRYLWQQAEGQRHAYDSKTALPQRGLAFAALCGAEVIPTERDITGKWLDPTCLYCDREIRIRLGFRKSEIPPLPRGGRRGAPRPRQCKAPRPQ